MPLHCHLAALKVVNKLLTDLLIYFNKSLISKMFLLTNCSRRERDVRVLLLTVIQLVWVTEPSLRTCRSFLRIQSRISSPQDLEVEVDLTFQSGHWGRWDWVKTDLVWLEKDQRNCVEWRCLKDIHCRVQAKLIL